MEKAQFNSVEVLEMAKEIEKKGRDFYTFYAEKTDKGDLKELFLRLAGDEKEHYQKFDELSKQAKKEADQNMAYIYNREVSAYLRSLVEFSVFPSREEEEEEFPDLENLNEVFNLAIMAEKESILFYQEMKEYDRGASADILQVLIEEEKQHLLDLTAYQHQL